MGAIFPDTKHPCHRCGNAVVVKGGFDAPDQVECRVCKMLGDRALVPLLRNPSKEALRRFQAAPKGSVLFEQQLEARGKRDKNICPVRI